MKKRIIALLLALMLVLAPVLTTSAAVQSGGEYGISSLSNPSVSNLTDGALESLKAELTEAIDLGFIPDSMVGNWTQPTSRLLAAEMIALLVEIMSGKSIDAIAAEKGFNMSDRFADSIDRAVTFLKAAGISIGVDGINYNPSGKFTRAQMVTMMGRMAENVFGMNLDGFRLGTEVFSDVPEYANRYIGWAADVGITLGVGGGLFDSEGDLQNQHTGALTLRAYKNIDKTDITPGPGPGPDPVTRPPDYDTRTSIRIGAARPITGRFASFELTGFGLFYKKWVEDVNARGGLYIAEYERYLPVELYLYDDQSDMATMLYLTEHMMNNERVDFIFPTCSTGMVTAQARVTSDNGYFLFGGEGGAYEIVENYQDYPNFFATTAHSVQQIPALVNLLKENNLTTAFVVYINDQHGLDYWDAAEEQFPQAGINIVNNGTQIPTDIMDMTPIIMDAMLSGADAFLLFGYTQQSYPAIEIMQELGYNPKFLLASNAICTEQFRNVFDSDFINGVSGWATWTPHVRTATQSFYDRMRTEQPGVNIDYWSHLYYEVILEVFERAVVTAGTLDNLKIAELCRSGYKFQTSVGEFWYENNSIAPEAYLGLIGQWQKGRVELVAGANITANLVVPKPDWP